MLRGANRGAFRRSGGLVANWFVDAVNGNDSNSGTAPAQAFATLAQLTTGRVKPGHRIALARGSSFREAWAPGWSGSAGLVIQVVAYGSGANPRVLGSSQVSSGSWSLVSGTEYQLASPLVFSGTHIMWDNGTGSGGTDGLGITALAKGTSGSLTANQYVITGGNIHVNIGRAPTAADKFEVPQRAPLVLDGISFVSFTDIDIGFSNGTGCQLSPTTATDSTWFSRCNFYWGISDLMNGFTKSTNSTIDSCTFHDTPNNAGDAISYHNDGSGRISNCTFRRIGKNGVVNSEKGTWTYYNNTFDGANLNIYTDAGVGTHQVVRNQFCNVKPLQTAGEPFIWLGAGTALTTGTVVNCYNNSVAMGNLPGDGGSTNVRGIRFDGGGTVTVKNNAVWATSIGGGTLMSIGLYKSAGSFAADSNNAVGGATTNNSGWATPVSLAADPYTATASRNLAPGPGSPLLGAGVAIASVTTGSPPDIGYTGAA